MQIHTMVQAILIGAADVVKDVSIHYEIVAVGVGEPLWTFTITASYATA